VYDWIVIDFFTVACENRLGVWYFRLSEQLSPERKHQKLIPCLCARSCLGESVSLERESLSSKRDSLAWARIRPEFGFFSVSSLAQARIWVFHYRLQSMGETFQLGREPLQLSVISLFLMDEAMFKCLNVNLVTICMNYYDCNMCGEIVWSWNMRRSGWTRISREILRGMF